MERADAHADGDFNQHSYQEAHAVFSLLQHKNMQHKRIGGGVKGVMSFAKQKEADSTTKFADNIRYKTKGTSCIFVVFTTGVFLGETVFCWIAAAFFVPCMSNHVMDFPVLMKISALEKAVQAQ